MHPLWVNRGHYETFVKMLINIFLCFVNYCWLVFVVFSFFITAFVANKCPSESLCTVTKVLKSETGACFIWWCKLNNKTFFTGEFISYLLWCNISTVSIKSQSTFIGLYPKVKTHLHTGSHKKDKCKYLLNYLKIERLLSFDPVSLSLIFKPGS